VFAGQTGLFGGVKIAHDGSNINPVALNLLNARNPDGSFVIPSPQTEGNSGVNYTAVLPGRYDEDQFNTNLDVSLTKADQLSTKFFFANTNLNLPFSGASVPGFPAHNDFNNRNLAIAHTHIFSPQAINQFRFGFSRISGRGFTPTPLTAQSVGISRVGDTQERSLPQMQVLGAFSLGNATTDKDVTANNNFYLSDTLALARGKYNLRLGEEIFRNQFNSTVDATGGALTFLSFPDFLLGLPAGPVNAGDNGTSFANVYASSVTAAVPDIGLRSAAAHFFVVNDYNVSPTLTLNPGFRLEVNGQPSEAHGRMASFYPEFYVPPPPGGFTNPVTSGFVLADNYGGPTPAGFPRENSTLLNDPVQLHLEPRLGFSWRPFPSRDVVIRGGYGIYADRIYFYSLGTALALSPPFTLSEDLIGGSNAAASLQFPFPVLPPASSFPNFAGTMLPGPPYTGDHNPFVEVTVDPAFREATVQQYGLEVQRQYKSFLISLAYAGAKSTHLPVSRSNNQSLLASPANPVNGLSTNSAANAVERVPFLGLQPIAFRVESSGNCNYNSLQATINKRLSHGLQMLAAYTFSKSIDTAGDTLGSAAFGVFGAPIFGQQVFNDQHNLAAQRGPSDFDRTHRFVLSYTWTLPQPVNRNRLLSGWAISGVVTLQSGLPFSIYDSAAGTLFGPATTFTTGSLAPGASLQDAIMSGNVSSRVNRFFNTSAFAPATLMHAGGLIDGQFPVSGDGTLFGSLGRNILRGPDQHNFDAALVKRTKLTEQLGIVFRWEVFNVLNHPNFANPASFVSSPSTFGKISAMSVNPRIMQFALKLEF